MSHFTWQVIPTLTTSHLLLRPITQADATALFGIYGNAAVMRYANDPPFSDVAALDLLFTSIEKLFVEHTLLHWGVVLCATGQLIGTCELHSMTADSSEAELGCLLTQEY